LLDRLYGNKIKDIKPSVDSQKDIGGGAYSKARRALDKHYEE